MSTSDKAAPNAGGAANQPLASLQYQSEPLAALLGVFSQWGSGGFIAALVNHSGHNLDPTSVVAITVLSRDGAMRPSALAERLRVGPSNVSKISNRLTELGLTERLADPHDARATLLGLTADGVALMGALVDAGDEMMARTLADWPDSDRAEFARLLQRFERDAARYAGVIKDSTSK